ncbi:PREDICTED: protein NRT1/ PTR FAMILY 2.7-like [Nelumbo nucifera]|uniref:Protein NRT1/ PTR FAMILY 2.7-like n=2 Tax=Nelumbo nucifera TaxID=4432 RepID=A0A1U7YWX0_NELNU|nr:PREDICTED: protein NRT1/ PTR FAMILY 2.7-like [Nelumbo nucifera]DAD27907.1 TPA_asm: hypothetical protein HUJ06_029375 [Nelumbo nucifera]
MSDTKLERPDRKLSCEPTLDNEAQTTIVGNKQGGWITFPFITVSTLGLTLASSGWLSNLTVYLIQQFNVKSIDAAQVYNVVSGCATLFPIAGAIIADSLGCFPVISVSSFISLLAVILFTITATSSSLKPPPCVNIGSAAAAESCKTPSKLQYGLLYSAIALGAIGMGGSRFTTATMGADQFNNAKDQGIFFNWYFFILYVASAAGATVIVYVEDNVGWGWGYGIAIGANTVGLLAFLIGKRYFRHAKPKGSPFTSLARVLVATIRKRKVAVSSQTQDYYYGHGDLTKLPYPPPTPSFKFLNRAALKSEEDIRVDGSAANQWRLCTVQEVEDLKALIRISPLWSTGIFVSVPIGILTSLIILEALRMDRHVGPHFKIPAGSFLVFLLISTALSLCFMDRFFYPTWLKLTRRTMTPLQRVGIGHILNITAMAASAIVESRRLHVARSHHLDDQPGSIVPMSALCLVAPLALVGAGEAFHFPGQVELYYQEFPASLRSTATAMVSLLAAVGFYLSTVVIDLTRRVTGWLPDDINHGRLDKVFWMLVVVGAINFVYYLICTKLYKYQKR